MVFLSLPSIAQVETVCAEILAAGGVRRRRRHEHERRHTYPRARRADARGGRAARRRAGRAAAASGRDGHAAHHGRCRRPDLSPTLEPLLSCMGSDIVHAGGVGAGQVLKIMNNMVLFINMNALAEALAIGRAAGVEPRRCSRHCRWVRPTASRCATRRRPRCSSTSSRPRRSPLTTRSRISASRCNRLGCRHPRRVRAADDGPPHPGARHRAR